MQSKSMSVTGAAWPPPEKCGPPELGLLPLELIHFQCAVAVADELHFRRAGHSLNMDQSAVSRRIMQLEAMFGYKLFERGAKVQLTDAGEAFISFARPVVEHARAAFLVAQAIGRGEPRELVVAYSPIVDTHLIAQMESLVARARPPLPVRFQSVPANELPGLILAGKCQAGVSILPMDSKLNTSCLYREKLLAAVPATHRLAAKPKISVVEFGDEPVIQIAREMPRAAYERILRLFRQAGYTPNVTREAHWVAEALGLVGEGIGLTFVKESDQRLHVEGLVMRPLTEQYLTVETGLSYIAEIKWTFLHEFVALMTSRFRCDPPPSA
jgi:DNA-binding transcriptional LysR family regulator